MIKLVVKSNTQETMTHCFDCATVTIGGENSRFADLILRDEPLQERHIQILPETEHNTARFAIVNLANDPLATINNIPFKKLPLHQNDVLKLGNYSILFNYDENSNNLVLPSLKPFKLTKNEDPVNPKIQQVIHQIKNSGCFQKKILKEKVGELNIPLKDKNSSKLSLKDYYLSEYDDDNGSRPKAEINSTIQQQTAKRWTFFLKILATLIGLMAILVGLIYVWVSGQSDEDEVTATKAIVDVAMALTYAQTKHIHPQNQNWSDPEFIRNNLLAVLATEYVSLAEFDPHGKFFNSPYMLRIYTSSDLSQFLVIAQPAPSILQWLIPKSSIVIDSRAMEMRKIKDIKILNRLLVNTNTLDRSNVKEISTLIQQGELIPLHTLINRKENQGFSPPKALALIRPNAENLIYNAPRYYSMGQNLLKKSIDLVDKPINQNEITLLQQELTDLTKFPHLVLYTTEGIQHAMQAQRALSILAPKEKFLIAYLQRNARGKISSTHLLMDDNPTDIALSDTPSENSFKDPIIYPPFNIEISNSSSSLNKEENFTANHDLSDSIFLQLKAAIHHRQQALKPIQEQIISLFTNQTQSWQIDFLPNLDALQNKYNQIDAEHQHKILLKFSDIIREHNHLPAANFIELIHNSKYDPLLKAYLNFIKEKDFVDYTLNQLEQQLHQIDESSNWNELKQNVFNTFFQLQFKNIPDEVKLVTYQNTTRSRILKKLNHFLLSSSSTLNANDFSSNYRQILIDILQAAWIVDPDTYDFYLREFDENKALLLNQ